MLIPKYETAFSASTLTVVLSQEMPEPWVKATGLVLGSQQRPLYDPFSTAGGKVIPPQMQTEFLALCSQLPGIQKKFWSHLVTRKTHQNLDDFCVPSWDSKAKHIFCTYKSCQKRNGKGCQKNQGSLKSTRHQKSSSAPFQYDFANTEYRTAEALFTIFASKSQSSLAYFF